MKKIVVNCKNLTKGSRPKLLAICLMLVLVLISGLSISFADEIAENAPEQISAGEIMENPKENFEETPTEEPVDENEEVDKEIDEQINEEIVEEVDDQVNGNVNVNGDDNGDNEVKENGEEAPAIEPVKEPVTEPVIGTPEVAPLSVEQVAPIAVGNDEKVAAAKQPKDHSEALTELDSADTANLITINLYDYESNINTNYDDDHIFPGFQQDGGTKSVSSLGLYSFNFGNNITTDLAATNPYVTNYGGDINATRNNTNSPISGAMYPKLIGGYPALANGESLKYLFSENTYAKKMNTANINGLFLYDEETGSYSFNSRQNHAEFNAATNSFTLYDELLSPNFMMYPFGNFLPFSNIAKHTMSSSEIDRAYLLTIANSAAYRADNGEGEAYSQLASALYSLIDQLDSKYSNGWTAADCANEYFAAAGISRSFTNEDLANIYTLDFDEPTNFFFGMEMSMDLLQPKGGITGKNNDQPMVFYFTGDDDVWVYLDGVLFLDLSGIHRHVGGEIDFAKGEVKYYSLNPDTGEIATTYDKCVSFAELVGEDALNEEGTFPDYSQHSFNFYYMERGAGSGVCRMNFNFPLLPQKSLAITKELAGEYPDELLKELRFDIAVTLAGEPLPIGSKYLVGTDEREVTEAGIIRLGANETAVINGIAPNTQFTVAETAASAAGYSVGYLLNGEAMEGAGKVEGSIDDSAVTVRVVNSPSGTTPPHDPEDEPMELPAAGGSGAAALKLLGAGLLLAGAVIYRSKRYE